MATTDDDFEKTTDLITAAFQLFDYPSGGPASDSRERAALMMGAAQAMATLMMVRENRVTNLLAAAYAPAELQVDPALTREAYEAAVIQLGILEQDEPEGMTTEQQVRERFADLYAEGQDPADKDVEK